MSKSYISLALRQEVVIRAGGCCEYCLSDSNDRAIVFAIDHIISEKHGGSTTINNLCLSCFWCNSFKGSDLSSVDWEDKGDIIPLFNPRQQKWKDHFRLEGVFIIPLTANGRVTVTLLQLNDPKRVKERLLLVELGSYPCYKV